MKIGEKVKILRKLRGYKHQVDFYRQIDPNIHMSAVSRWESTKYDVDIPHKYLFDIAEKLNVDYHVLADSHVEIEDMDLTEQSFIIDTNRPVKEIYISNRLIPLIDRAPNNKPPKGSERILLPQVSWIDESAPLSEYMALCTPDNSNAPQIEKDDLVIFRVGDIRKTKSGSFGVFSLPDKTLFVRKVAIPFGQSKDIYLDAISHNKDLFPRLTYSKKKFGSHGKVVLVQKRI